MDKELKSIIDETIDEFFVMGENILGKEFKMRVKGQEFPVITNPYASGFRSVAFLPDGKQIASFTHDTKEGAEMDLYKQLQTKFVGESVDEAQPVGGEKRIEPLLPQIIKIVDEGNVIKRVITLLTKEGWNDTDAWRELKKLSVDDVFTSGVHNGMRNISRGATTSEFTDDWMESLKYDMRRLKKATKESVDGMPPSGEEKYLKQQPGGDVMGAANTTTLATETQAKSEREESKIVAPRDFERFVDKMMNFVNASNVPLKVTVTEFTVNVSGQSAKTYIVRVDNG